MGIGVTPEFSQCCGVDRGRIWGRVQMKACVLGPKERGLHPVMPLSQGRWDAVSKVTGLACFLGSALGVRGRIPASLGNG